MLNQPLFLSLRCFFITNCASPATWQVLTVSNKTVDDGKWHKLMIRRDFETSLTVCEVDGFSKETTVLGLDSYVNRVLFFGGIPNRSHGQGIIPNETCFPNLRNFSGCVTGMKINAINSHGHAQVIYSDGNQFGTVWNHCADEKHKFISIVDKNAKVLLKVNTENCTRPNTSLEFRIRTKTDRGVVVKITHDKLTALLFLEEGKMKVTVRGENGLANEGRSPYIATNGTFVADNQWHGILFAVVMEVEAILRIDDSLERRHAITSARSVTSKVVSTDTREQYVMLRFGRNSRKNLAFVGCVGDVYLNNQAVNFSKHPSVRNGKGISVGNCPYSAGKEHIAWRHDKKSNGIRSTATEKTLTTPESSMGAERIPWAPAVDEMHLSPSKKAIAQTESSMGADRIPWAPAMDEIHLSATEKTLAKTESAMGAKDGTEVTSTFSFSTFMTRAKSSRKFEVYPVALGIGLPVSFLLIVSIFGASLKSRLQSWRRRTGIEKNREQDHSKMPPKKNKENYTANVSASLSADYHRGKDAFYKVTKSASGIKHESFDNENQAFAEKNPAPVIWEERYGLQGTISRQRSLVPGKSRHSFQSLCAEASDRLTGEQADVRLIIPPYKDCVIVPKNGSPRRLADTTETESSVEQGTSMCAASRNRTRSHRVYSGYNSLPRPSKKASSLSWAYGTRFVRHESSDTDCSDAERVSGKRQGYQVIERAKFITVRPRQQRVRESRGNEGESLANNLQMERNQRLRTFTEKTYPLQSVKEEDPENESEYRGSFSSNAGKVYYTDKKMRYRNRSTSLAEASILYKDPAAKGTQLRTTLDDYTSSCPDSIHCLSEKEDSCTKQFQGFQHNVLYI